MKKTLVCVGTAAVLCLLVLVGVAGLAVGVAEACDSDGEADTDTVAHLVAQSLSATDASAQARALSDHQVQNAVTIQTVGVEMDVPTRGQVIALAVALQESGLRNVDYGDRDSLGLFQQRPSQGWGTAEEIMDPEYAATQFYQALLEVDGWQELSLTQAAQAVQRSAYPNAYARWETLATELQQAIADALEQGDGGGSTACQDTNSGGADDPDQTWGDIAPGTIPDGYQVPQDAPKEVRQAITWALEQLGTPYQWGGTCTKAHGSDPMGRCDCSSLVQQAYAAAGITLPRTTYLQVDEGRRVSLSQVAPGDLLFTQSGSDGPDHVGMYIGSGLVIHAPKTGDVVRLATFTSWKSQVVTVRRIVD